MIILDGKESGGQILRTALGLSAITNKPIKVINIRGARKDGGLKTQHLEGVLAVSQLCNAEVKGATLGSKELEFIPKKLESKDLNIKISTAGSIGLLYQSLQIPAAFTNNLVNIHVTGGSTASAWSPTIHFTKNVFLPIVRKMGYNAEIEIIREGFYPKGGAEVNIKVYPVKKLNAIELIDKGKIKSVEGISVAGSLPKNVADRQAESAKKILNEYGIENVKIDSFVTKSISPGTCIAIWAKYENTIIGSDNIGEKGKPAEKVGEECAKSLIKSIESNATLDKWMSDQILVFIALADGKSKVKVEEFTDHVKSNIKVIEAMLNVKFELDEENKMISVEGIGYKI